MRIARAALFIAGCLIAHALRWIARGLAQHGVAHAERTGRWVRWLQHKAYRLEGGA